MTVGKTINGLTLEGDSAADALIVGAGVIGMAVARELADRGADVVVVDRGDAGAATSRVAAGMLAPVAEAAFGEERLLALTLEAAKTYPGFVEQLERETGVDTGFMQCGALHIALDRDEASELHRRLDFLHDLDLDPEWLTPSACRRIEPELASSFGGGMRVPEESSVDPRLLCRALERSLRTPPVSRAGTVTLRTGPETEVVGSLGGPARVEGVELRSGERVKARDTVVATGALRGAHDWLPERARPRVRPVKGQILELGPRSVTAPELLIRGIVATERVYLVPRTDGRVVVGATVEEQGYDTAVTAGGIYELLREAYRAVPEVAELELLDATAGLRPATPDNLPLVGGSGIDGVIYATGHYRNGILLAPLAARTVADVVQGAAVA